MYTTPTKSRMQQAGMSLIELMIAMVVGLILMAGVLSIFISSRQSYGVNSGVAQVQENGRFALYFIKHTARMAGYIACGGSSTIGNHLNTPTATTLPFDLATPITGFEYSGTAPTNTYNITAETPAPVGVANWSPTLVSNFPTSGQGYPIPGSDVLVVRYTPPTTTAAYVDPANPPTGSTFNLTTNPGIQAGSILAITDCVNTYIVQADAVSGTNNDVVEIDNSSAEAPGNDVTGIPSSFIGAQVAAATTAAFYIGEGSDGSPALFEAITDPSAANGFDFNELVTGVENMQVLYGIDTSGDLTPSQYVTADNVADWTTVVSARVALLLRSNTAAVPLPTSAQKYTLLDSIIEVPLDTRLRKVFTTTIALRDR
ncbi:MAG: PilW family protein [Gammaproteobacteria bacterium]